MQTDPTDLTGEEEVVLPASYAQQRMWFLERIEGGAVYNVPVVSRLHGALDVAALEQAFDGLVRRHETLRTVFTVVDGVPHQLIRPAEPFALPVVDVSGADDPQEMATELAAAEALRPFDLAEQPPFRALLVVVSPEEHVLALTLHHVVTDAWSTRVLNRELAALYEAAASGSEAQLPELEIQYADYAVWQQQWLESGGLDRQLSYWREHLAGAPPLLELPTDRPRPAQQSFRGASERLMLSRDLSDRIRELGDAEGATLFMTLLAGLATLLSRASGQEDVVVATPVANRSRTELEAVIGLFVNTLALRLTTEPEPTFRELVAQAREVSLGAFSNQDLPFEKLVESLTPERHLSHAPVAQVMFVVQNAVEERTTFADLRSERVATDRGTAKFDLTFFAAETADGLRLSVEYCTDLFEAATARRFLEHFRSLLEAAVAAPDTPVGRLALLGDAERRELDRWNETAVEYGAALIRPVHELVAAQAARTPDATAVVLGGEALTYAELDARANRLARRLQDAGARPGTVVAVCAERSVETVVGVLATLKAGAAYTPIDPAYPGDRVAYMLEDSAAPVLLTQERLLPTLPETAATTILLDVEAPEEEGDDAPLPPAAGLDDGAYLIYTSGSTGRPKGVLMSHRPLANLLAWQLAAWTAQWPQPEARTLQFASLSFDVAFQEIFSTWSSGGTLVLLDEETRRNPEALLGHVRAARIERLFLPFVALRNLCETAEYLGAELPDLREVITAGEQLKVTDAMRAFFTRTGAALVNQYGPTESHVATAHVLTGPPEGWPELPPIGTPIANVHVRLLDRHGLQVPVGVPGELCIGGVCLADGYLGRPELTEERFGPDPFSGEGARLYRTGDRARYLASGEIEYLGRTDHQLKIRGFRVEPGEVETALRAHPDVRESLVVAHGEGEAKRLVAYVIGEPERTSADELRAFLGRSLPDYMIPSAFATLAAFPLSPNGKVDRSALPSPDDAGAGTAYVAPRTPTEAAVVEIWERLLGVSRIGADDNFFSLGGHSLLATQLVSRVRDAVGVELPLRVVFEHPTVSAFARTIDESAGAPTSPRITATPRPWDDGGSGATHVQPASYAEQRLWFLDRVDPGASAYIVGSVVRLRGSLDVAALERAVETLVHRHESLRTTYSLVDDVPHRVVRRPGPVELPVLDAESEEQALELARTEGRRPFDLEQGPLFRAALVRRAADDHVLVLSLHHIVVDGWSLGVLNRELSALYRAYAAGDAPDLALPPLQYGDFAAWQHDWIEGGGLDAQIDYWRTRLAGAPALLELPTDRPRPPRQSFRGAVVRDVVAPDVVERLRSIGEREGTTLFMTLLAAFGVLLSRYSDQRDLVVASPVAGRERSELEDVVGFFVNTLPLRLDLDGDPTFRDLLARVRETSLGAFSNQDLPFEKLVEEINPERHLSYSPVAQVLFVLQASVGETALDLPGLVQEPVRGARLTTKFDLSLYAIEGPEGLRISFEYSTDLFDRSTLERMLEQYATLLESVVDAPDRQVSRLALLTPAEREAVLAEFAGAPAAFPVWCLHERFAEQARRTPGNVAVVHEDASLTYAELDERSSRLAHVLVAEGVGPEVLVALCLERSLDLVVAILAVLKAGGAYVPLDPDYPADRIAFALEDTAAPVLLTQEHFLEQLPHAATVICLDRDAERIAGAPAGLPAAGAQPENAAYVIYTSGSTGRPKGVTVEHRNVARLFTATDHWFEFTADDAWSLVHSYAFDFSVWELWGALLYGGKLVIVPAATTRSPVALRDLLVEQRVTVLNSTPSLFVTALDDMLRRSGELALRVVVFGGEALQPASLQPWFERFGSGGPRLVNMYGITETTVHVTYRPLLRADADRDVSPIGEPIPDLQTYVLDAHLEPVPEGVPGELFVGGAGVARGYLNRPELTEERFLENPFGAGRLYRTGDRARHVAGELLYLGRIDHQVKIRGFRIELGEIESALREHTSVRDALVLAREDGSGDRRLVAYVLTEGTTPPAHELRELLAQSLPKYMLPSAILFLASYPLTSNGKVDRNALLALPISSDVERERLAPRTETERELAVIWRKLLSLDEVGVDEDFFELGGHSLMAIRLVAQIERSFDVRLPLSALFEAATIESLAALLEQEEPEQATWSPVVPLRAGSADEPALFLVAWPGGEVLPYRDLVEAMQTHVPVIGLRAPGADRRTTPLGSVEDLADFYAQQIRSVQPSGPYRLGGYCFAGIVAYEIARRFQDDGHTIDALIMLDSFPFKPPTRKSAHKRALTQLDAFRTADRLGRRQWVKDRVRILVGRVGRMVYTTRGPRIFEWLLERKLEHHIPHRPWNLVLIASNRARWRYVPRPLDVRVDFYRAEPTPDARKTPWNDVASEVVIHPISAEGISHESMMYPPHVGLLARELSRRLRGDLTSRDVDRPPAGLGVD